MDTELKKLREERDLLKLELENRWKELAAAKKLPRVRCIRLTDN